MTRSTVQPAQSFVTAMQGYKTQLDDDIATYAKHVQKTTLQQYGASARLVTDAYLSILERGGKRIRGALTMVGYEMSGGTDQAMILQAARAIEMLHAYILIVDDIQDRSHVRRGQPTAHVMLADYHRQKDLSGDVEHFGEAMALNASLIGAHAAQMVLANLNAPEELRLKVVSIVNRTMLVTAHGQTGDIMNEAVASVTEADVDNVLERKTAHYTILNPLHVGMVLAGADCHATDAITEYALQVGRAFQITDDIIGTFGSAETGGKSPLDDIKEGKRTLLTVYALQHASGADKNFLITMLGNSNLNQAEFLRCKEILVKTGAVEHATKQAQQHVHQALAALNKEKHRWSADGVAFLSGLAEFILTRNA